LKRTNVNELGRLRRKPLLRTLTLLIARLSLKRIPNQLFQIEIAAIVESATNNSQTIVDDAPDSTVDIWLW
jgi:hypothetical protein